MIKSFSPIEFELYFQYQNEDPRSIWGKKRFWNTNTSPKSINWLRLVFTASKYPIDWTRIADLVFKLTCFTLSMCLDCVYRKASCICPFFFFFFFLSNQFSRDYALFSRSCTLRSILRLAFFFFFFWEVSFHVIMHCFVGLMHYSQDPQVLYSKKKL